RLEISEAALHVLDAHAREDGGTPFSHPHAQDHGFIVDRFQLPILQRELPRDLLLLLMPKAQPLLQFLQALNNSIFLLLRLLRPPLLRFDLGSDLLEVAALLIDLVADAVRLLGLLLLGLFLRLVGLRRERQDERHGAQRNGHPEAVTSHARAFFNSTSETRLPVQPKTRPATTTKPATCTGKNSIEARMPSTAPGTPQ